MNVGRFCFALAYNVSLVRSNECAYATKHIEYATILLMTCKIAYNWHDEVAIYLKQMLSDFGICLQTQFKLYAIYVVTLQSQRNLIFAFHSSFTFFFWCACACCFFSFLFINFVSLFLNLAVVISISRAAANISIFIRIYGDGFQFSIECHKMITRAHYRCIYMHSI